MKHRIWITVFPVFLATLMILPVMAFSQTAREIMELVENRDDGETSKSNTTMILIDKRGNQRIRQLRGFRKDYGKDSKSIMFFLSPADVKNTSYLSYDWDDSGKEDDTWLYLPALRKVKRIASDDKSGSFMGSDFTYSDMNGPEIDDWDYSFAKQKEVKVDGHDAWVILGKPKKEKLKKVVKETGYVKSQVWIRKDVNMLIQGKFWVKKGRKIKYLKAEDIKQVDGIWTAHQMQMTTTKRGRKEHSSVMKIGKVQYNIPIKDSEFTTQRMERGL